MISQDSIRKVKDAANIVDVVGKFINLKKDGVNLVACCPFHNEKSPSFKVSQSKQIYKCFGCGESGDSFDFVMKHKNMKYIEAVKFIADMYNISLDEEIMQPKRIYKKPSFSEKVLSNEFLSYFLKRGISESTLKTAKVTQASEWMPKANTTVDTVCFNYFRNGELINIKYRADNKDFKLSKEAEIIFYNIDSVKDKDYAIITEGEIDCLSCIEVGMKSVVSVPNGAAKGNLKLEYLETCFDAFKDKKTILLFTDNDEAGQILQKELLRRFGYDRCLKVDYPDGCKDANDILVNIGADKLKEVIRSAKEFPIEGIISIDELYRDINDFYRNGYPKGVRVGISGFDELVQFMQGQFTTVTGIPGCFTKNQLVHTETGVKPISEIKIGEKVLSYNHERKVNEYRGVKNTFVHETHTDKLFRIKLKDGTTIEVTENHLFFNGIDYVKIKDYLVPLNNETMEKNT